MALRQARVDAAEAGLRIDVFVTRRFRTEMAAAGISRAGVQRMIAEGLVTINGEKPKPSTRVRLNDLVELRSLPARPVELKPEPLPLQVLFEDEDCIVINKAPGMIVHPAAGRTQGTLVNALLHRCADLAGVGGERRPGIVHRLDKDTSGVLIVAKNDFAYQGLARQFKQREIEKEYVAVVWGKMPRRDGVIDRPIGRHRSDRKRMSSLRLLSKGREAVTHWRLEECFELDETGVSVVRVRPTTGRTHQIRVHLADSGHPIVGDRVYGRKRFAARSGNRVRDLVSFPRQALHAERLTLTHPRSGERVSFLAPLWPDMAQLLDSLRRQAASGVDKKADIQ